MSSIRTIALQSTLLSLIFLSLPSGAKSGEQCDTGASAKIDTQAQNQTRTGIYSSIVTGATPVMTENTAVTGFQPGVLADPLIEGLDNVTAPKKEKLPDRTTTLDDGRIMVDKDLDGDGDYEHTEVTYPDGTKVVRDIKVEMPEDMGSETIKSDTHTTYPDGRTETIHETNTTPRDDSKTERTWPDGKTQTETSTRYGAGEKYGQSETVTETKWPDGKTQTVTVTQHSDSDPGDKTVVTKFPDGRTQVDTDNGVTRTTETTYPDGTKSSVSESDRPSGGTITTTKDRDGTTRTDERLGGGGRETTVTHPDGSKEVSGQTIGFSQTDKTYPDGTKVHEESLGGRDSLGGGGYSTTKTFPDGRKETIIQHGNGGTSIIKTGEDGKSTTSYLPPSTGRGEPRSWPR